MGPGLVSSGLLGFLLLQHLEGRQVVWKSQRENCYKKNCNRVTAARQNCRVLKSVFRLCLIFLEGGVLHGHVSVCDAADPAHPGTDLTWSCGRDLLLPVPKHQRPGEPGGILLGYHVGCKEKTAAGGGKQEGTKKEQKLKVTYTILLISMVKPL